MFFNYHVLISFAACYVDLRASVSVDKKMFLNSDDYFSVLSFIKLFQILIDVSVYVYISFGTDDFCYNLSTFDYIKYKLHYQFIFFKFKKGYATNYKRQIRQTATKQQNILFKNLLRTMRIKHGHQNVILFLIWISAKMT